jgi:methyltransferase-like protein/trans-aconitate methyltransferase
MDAARAISYDEVPYTSLPFLQTHPDRLACLATLFGLQPPALDACRVLELGCASGGNLVPMAVALPRARFVGVDLSPVQIADARTVVAALALDNIEFRAASIADVDDSWGAFDYIIAQGVFSYVPPAVQQRMLEICARQLTPHGIAFISYNTLPGWRSLGVLRDLMRFHTAPLADPQAKIREARAIADFLLAGTSASGMLDPLLKSYIDALRDRRDDYVVHEYLEETNEAVYFHEFVERASAHGLQYLADADFATMLASNIPRDVAQRLARLAPGALRQEQYVDFVRNRTFRQSLLVREGLPANRRVTPERLRRLSISGTFRPEPPRPDAQADTVTVFRGANDARLQTSNLVTAAAARILTERWPAAVPFGDLLREATARLRAGHPAWRGTDAEAEAMLAADLLQCFGAGLVQFHSGPTAYAAAVGERPRVSPLARLQARRAMQVTNLRHEIVQIDGDLARLMQILDGVRSRESVERTAIEWARAAAAMAGAPATDIDERARAVVAQSLARLAGSALLLA